MGNTYSHLTRQHLSQQDWQEYAKAGWRSQKARDLDRLGGIGRQAIARGQSFDASLDLLGDVVLQQAHDIKEVLSPDARNSAPARPGTSAVLLRAQLRPYAAKPAQDAPSPQLRPRTSWATGASDAEKRALLDARKRMMEYGQRLSDAQSVRSGSQSSCHPAAGSIQPASVLAATGAAKAQAGQRTVLSVAHTTTVGSTAASALADRHAARETPAAWRVRMYAARRRTILAILCVVRLKCLLMLPARLRRVDSFSLYVSKVLGDASVRVADEQRKLHHLKLDIDAAQLILGNTELLPYSSGGACTVADGSTGGAASIDFAFSTPAAQVLQLDTGHQVLSFQQHTAAGEPDSPAHNPFRTAGETTKTGDSAVREAWAATTSPVKASGSGSLKPTNSNKQLLGSAVVITPSTTPHIQNAGGGALAMPPGETDTPHVLSNGLPRSAAHLSAGYVQQFDGSKLAQDGGDKQQQQQGSSRQQPSVEDRSSAPADTRNVQPERFSGLLSGAQQGGTLGNHSLSMPAQREVVRPRSAALSELADTASVVSFKTSLNAHTGREGGLPAGLDATAEALGSLLTEMEAMPEHKQQQWLSDRLENKAAAAQQAGQLMRMHVNRSNAKWAEGTLPWSAPHLWDTARCAAKLGNPAYEAALEEMRQFLADGQIAVSIMCGEGGELVLPNGSPVDLWAADPWKVVEAARPGCMPLTDRVAGVSLGARIILQLLVSVAALAGPQAAQRLTLLLHCSDQQLGEVMGEVYGRRHFGLDPQNIIIMPQPLWPGHRFHPSSQTWARDPLSPGHSLGTGYGAFLLSWVGGAMTLSPEGNLVPLPGSVVETLETRGIKWLMMEGIRDLTLLSTIGALDLAGLATLQLLHRQAGVNMGVWCMPTASTVVSRQVDSVVVCANTPRRCPQPVAPVPTRRKPPSHGGQRRHTMDSPRQTLHASRTGYSNSTPSVAADSAYASSLAELGLQPVVELRHSELLSPMLQGALAQCKSQPSSMLAVGLARYAFHLPSLRALLVEFPFRARLTLVGSGSTWPSATQSTGAGAVSSPADLLGVQWDVADLLALPQACCVPIKACYSTPSDRSSAAGAPPQIMAATSSGGSIVGPPAALPQTSASLRRLDDLPLLSYHLQAQDHDAAFRKLLAMYQNARQMAQVIGPAMGAGQQGNGQAIVVLISAINTITDNAVALAAQLARPGHDSLHLVTVVPTSLAQREGEVLLQHYYLAALPCMANIQLEVLIRHPWTVLDVLDWYCMRVEAGVVLMASSQMTAVQDVTAPAVLGSLTLAAIRRLSTPVLVVTANMKRPEARQPLSAGAAAVAAASMSEGYVSTGHVAKSDHDHPGQVDHNSSVWRTGLTPAQQAVASALGAGGLRMMLLVDRHSKAMLHWLCKKVLHAPRGDTLLLAQVVPSNMCGKGSASFRSNQQRLNFGTVLNAFQAVATGNRVPVADRLQLFGALDKQLTRAADDAAAGVVAVQLPPGRIPRELLQLIQSSRAGVLIYKEPQTGSPAATA